MLDVAMQEALQQQVTAERQNSVAYLSLSNKAEIIVLPGLAEFLAAAGKEETEHAEKFSTYLIDRNVEPLTAPLSGLTAPDCMMLNAGRVLLSAALVLEQQNTVRIMALCRMALDAGDYQTFEFLKWAVAEQTSAERELMDMIAQWAFAEGCASAVPALDHELGED